MVKSIITDKVYYACKTLDYIKRTIDPDAFISGGYAVELALGKQMYGSDIDIYFKSKAFDLDYDKVSSFKMLNAVLHDYNLKECEYETYYYHKKVRKIASFIKPNSFLNIDLIQYDSSLSIDEVLKGFDLDECKVIVNSSVNYLNIQTTKEFDEAWDTPEIKPHYSMFDDDKVNLLQNEKTKQRVKKWKERKLNYFKYK